MDLLFYLSVAITIFGSTVFGYDDCGTHTTYTATSGTIISHAGIDHGHNYGKNMYCTWHIRAPVGKYVELTAETFEVGGTGLLTYCNRDYINLYDGPFTNSTSLGSFCGGDFTPISSTGRDLTILFRTDSYNSYGGFKLHYNFTDTVIYSCRNGYFLCTVKKRCVQNSWRCDGDDDCGDDTDEQNCPPFTCSSSYFPCVKERRCISTSDLCDGNNDCTDGSDEVPSTCKGGQWKCGQLNYTGSTGTLQSPNYPRSYPTDMSCKYEIYPPAGTSSVKLTFATSFNIESDVKCQYDYVKVYTIGKTSKTPANTQGPFCGTKAPSRINLAIANQTEGVIVEFNSDNSDSYAGFSLTWTAV